MVNKNEKKRYESPRVTSVDFMVENGFTPSQGTIDQNNQYMLGFAFDGNPVNGTENAEGRYNAGNWGGDDGWF